MSEAIVKSHGVNFNGRGLVLPSFTVNKEVENISDKEVEIMSTVQRTSVEALRRELHLRFEDEEFDNPQGASELLSELVIDPKEQSAFPLFFQRLSNDAKKKAVPAGRRVPSKEGDALPDVLPFHQPSHTDSLPCSTFPPHTSRGVTIPKLPESEIKENDSVTPAVISNVSGDAVTSLTHKILGGYDGGVEVGFNGEWSPLKFKSLCQTLETAKIAAENDVSDERFVTLDNLTFAVNPHGANNGAHYKYVIEGSGTKIYIHANPKGPIQPVRIRYGFESLAGRDLFHVHANTLDWLKEIGFTVQKETVSRVDLQVMLFRAIADLITPIFANRSVKRASKFTFHGKGNTTITSYTLGSKIQLCIYDKRRELIDTCDEVKMSLLVNDCLGGEFPDELTRIEYRLRRDALKYFGINTIQDLLEKENALVDYLTFDWFRLLKVEKSRSNSATQEIDNVWQEVRDLFFEYFPGPVENRKPIERNNSRREVKCTGDSLIKQAVGCLATAAALAKGVFETECQALSFVADVVTEKVKTLVNRVRERVVELGIVRGVEVPDAIDWHLNPQYACASSDDALKEFRVVFDEDLQYDRFRKFSVAGCPF